MELKIQSTDTMCASKRDRMISDQLFVILYTIYLSLCTQTADPIMSEIQKYCLNKKGFSGYAENAEKSTIF